MKQYCKYCVYCFYRSVGGNDLYTCTRLGFTLKTSAALRANTCKSFALGGFDVKTGRAYVSREERAAALDGQMIL